MTKSNALRKIKIYLSNIFKKILDKYNALHHIITMTQSVMLTPKVT